MYSLGKSWNAWSLYIAKQYTVGNRLTKGAQWTDTVYAFFFILFSPIQHQYVLLRLFTQIFLSSSFPWWNYLSLCFCGTNNFFIVSTYSCILSIFLLLHFEVNVHWKCVFVVNISLVLMLSLSHVYYPHSLKIFWSQHFILTHACNHLSGCIVIVLNFPSVIELKLNICALGLVHLVKCIKVSSMLLTNQ